MIFYKAVLTCNAGYLYYTIQIDLYERSRLKFIITNDTPPVLQATQKRAVLHQHFIQIELKMTIKCVGLKHDVFKRLMPICASIRAIRWMRANSVFYTNYDKSQMAVIMISSALIRSNTGNWVLVDLYLLEALQKS